MALEGEGTERRGLPRLAWGPVIAGVLLALAAHIVMGLIGSALGLAAEPADSRALGALAGFWGLLTPLVATALGAWLACKMAERFDEVGSNLHGVMVWSIGLVAGALFLASAAASGAMSAGAAASGNAGVLERLGGARAAAAPGMTGEEAAKRAATAAGGGAMAALCGLLGAFAGAGLARTRREGRGRGRGLGWRIAIQRTGRQAAMHTAERAPAPRAYGEDVRDVARDEGPGAPPTEPPPYHH